MNISSAASYHTVRQVQLLIFMIPKHRGRWVCAHIIKLPKGKEQLTHCVHPRKKKPTCCGEDKSGFRKAAGDTVDDKC